MSIQSTLSELRQWQSTVEMTVGDGMAQGTQPSYIDSPVGRLLLNFDTAASGGYVTLGNAQRVGFEGHNTGDVTLDFQGYAPILENLLNTDYGSGNLTITGYNAYGTLSAYQWFGAGLTVENCPNLAALDFRSGGFGDNATGNFYATNCAALTAIYLDSIYGEAVFTNLPNLTTLYFFGGVATQVWLTDGLFPNLANVVFEGAFYGASINLPGCALTQASVESILSACVNGGQSNGYINVSSGTSSPPILDTGAAAAWTTITIPGDPTVSPTSWYYQSPVYFTLFDGFTFWINYDCTGDGTGNTPDPGIEGEGNLYFAHGMALADMLAAMGSYLSDLDYDVSIDGVTLTVNALTTGYQSVGIWSDQMGYFYSATYPGANNNANSEVIALQGLGWTVLTN